MIYSAIYGEVQALAFDTSATVLAQIKNWITAREGEIWQYADWPQKESLQLNVTVVGGTATVALPAGFTWTTQGIQLVDNYGDPLEYMEPRDFFRLYGAAISSPPSTGSPEAWTLTTDPVGGTLQIRVGPTPTSSTTFSVQGWTLPVKRTAATTWTLGTMSADSDLPWWPDAYHYFLIPGVIAYGKRLRDGLGWEALESDFQQGLRRLQQELMPPQREVEIWGESLASY